MTFAKKHNTVGYKFSFEIPDNFEYYDLQQLAKKYKTLDKIIALMQSILTVKVNLVIRRC